MFKVGVIGAGRAGRARLRAIEAHPDAELAGVVSSQPDISTRSLEELLADDEVDAVCVCSINSAHARQVRQVLEAGKHVLCEYPLALTHADATELFDLARDRSQVLHVEHIELLSGTQRALREAYEELGRPRPAGGTYYSQANSEGWIADIDSAGFPSFSGISRLHRLVDLFGDASVSDASWRDVGEEQHLSIELAFEAGGTCNLDYRRGRGLPRHEKWEIECDDGELTTPSPVLTPSLFEQDFESFVLRVEENAEPYVSDSRVLDVLKLADDVRERCASPVEV